MIESRKNYTVTEAARLAGVSRCTILRDCVAGNLPFKSILKAGGKMVKKYIAGRDLERYRLRNY